METTVQQIDNIGVSAPQIILDQLIDLCIEKEASDIHFREDSRIALRVGGRIIFIENAEKLSKEEVEMIIHAMIPDKGERDKLEINREIDFSYTHKNGINFRVNVFYQKGKLAGVMRMISKNIPTLEELKVPHAIKEFFNLRQGLILICGTAGSGKSTTIQSILRYINENYVKHILTIENPIEYVFEDKKSIFTQREVGKDTLTEVDALRSAAREDANVIMIGEIRNFETLDNILELVETGHLVISSISTRDAAQAIERMISMCSHDTRENLKERIAENLTAILAQDLVQKQNQTGLVAVFEFMFVNQVIKNIIKNNNFLQLRSAIQSSADEGMIAMGNYAYELAEQGIISQEQLAEYNRFEE